jgi:hypothetical protein
MKNNTFKSKLFRSIMFTSVSFIHGCSAAATDSRFQQTSQASASQGYTDSIKALADEAISVVDKGMREFNEKTLPHEAKDLRKQIVRLRDILDIFAHNLAHKIDLWDEVRDGLDDGYTVVGDYKDLFDTDSEAVRAVEAGKQPEYKNPKKLKERRKKVLEWKSIYFADNGLSGKIKALFLSTKELNPSNIINSKRYSSFFWGGVDSQPLSAASPAENARRLIDAQAELATREHHDVLDIKDPSTEKNELIFHDHRKRLRTIAKICNVANSLTAETCNSAAVKEIESLVVDLGEIEDLIITGRHLREDGEKKKAENSYDDAQKLFKKLKKRFEGQDMLAALKSL